jgi:hypothetical protein
VENRYKCWLARTPVQHSHECGETMGGVVMVIPIQKPDPEIVQKYRDFLSGLLQRLGAEAEVKYTASDQDVDFSISIVPAKPNAAPVRLDVAQGDFAFMHIGAGTTFEIPPSGGGNLPLGQMEQIELFMAAAADGRIEENLTYSKGRIVATESRVWFEDPTLKEVRRSSVGVARLNPFSEKTKRRVTYEPYSRRTGSLPKEHSGV